MRTVPLFLLLLLGHGLRADPINPTITETVTYTGSGFAQAVGQVLPNGFGLNAEISGFAETQSAPGSAQSTINLQGEFLAAGTGSATLQYSVNGGTANGSAQFQLYDIAGSCGPELCLPGGGPNDETIQLGVPFYLDLSGNANAFGGIDQKNEYSISVQFLIYQNGISIPITEVPLPTPEPGTFYFAGLATLTFLAASAIHLTRRISK